MIELVNSRAPLPKNVSIHPYAQEIYRGKWQEYKLLIQKLMEFDKLFKSEVHSVLLHHIGKRSLRNVGRLGL